MRRVLILQHDWAVHKGYIGDILAEHDIVYDVVDVAKETLPDPTIYAAIIALGGTQHVYESDEYPYFTQEKAMIRLAVEQDIPFLGICLGSQLLASALGAAVKKHTTPEIGFFEVPFTGEGETDPLYKGLSGYQKVFHWHGDTFDLPSGAVLLATNEHTKNQAFRYGHCAYGVQYHIEVTPQILASWLDLYQNDVPPELSATWLHHSDLPGRESNRDYAQTTQRKSVYPSWGWVPGRGNDRDYADTMVTIEREQNSYFPMYLAHARKMFGNFLSISRLI